MKAQNEAGLTDNVWVERIGQLRQMVSDQYDTTQNTTPREFVDWLVENAEEEFDSADERILLRAAEAARLDNIHDWLADGDLDGDETAEQLAAEYIEYCETAAEAVGE